MNARLYGALAVSSLFVVVFLFVRHRLSVCSSSPFCLFVIAFLFVIPEGDLLLFFFQGLAHPYCPS